ncbi:MAG: HAMP domain-containing histidine kinase [Xanthobacteraceae bacterium]|nr:HAMP domain-containing histidine kinase [Xanthobacteraceae bacterium]MBV9626521.1 HAMP domain-containing histidine kinase [Xanthobacteraceae bacterium]
MLRHLYLQFYVGIVVILVIFVVAFGFLWRVLGREARLEDKLAVAGELLTAAMPPATASREQQRDTLEQFRQRLGLDLSIYAPDSTLIASAGRPVPALPDSRSEHEFVRGPPGPVWLLRLHDGRFLVARVPGGRRPPGTFLLFLLVVVALAVGLGAYPVARRLTRRLERLKAGVEQLGEGDLSARVQVEGRDEVASLAESFNQSASRVQELMRAHKMLLANCSHELRTPLTRINLALSLAGDRIDPQRRADLKADIAELDQLIEELLLASRLDAIRAPESRENIDLLALAAEEAARDGIPVEGRSLFVRGDRTLLRRLIRNLLDNARRHGGDPSPQVEVQSQGANAVFSVRDHGPGIAESERDRIFAPFYRPAGTSQASGSNGLGLALVRQIARTHGGDVECRAADGGGTVFIVSLPKIGEAPLAAPDMLETASVP